MKPNLFLTATAVTLALAAPAYAKPGDPVKATDTLTIDPIVEGASAGSMSTRTISGSTPTR